MISCGPEGGAIDAEGKEAQQVALMLKYKMLLCEVIENGYGANGDYFTRFYINQELFNEEPEHKLVKYHSH